MKQYKDTQISNKGHEANMLKQAFSNIIEIDGNHL